MARPYKCSYCNGTTTIWKIFRSMMEGIQEFTDQEKSEMDFRLMGQFLHDQAFRLSRKVNKELLEPISQWLSDDDWVTRFRVYEQDAPNWAEYKRKQREWNDQQKQLFAERMKAYRQEIHKRRNLRREMAAIIPRTSLSRNANEPIGETAYLTAILEPFSPPGEKRAETHQKFMQARSLSAADILPWRLIIALDLKKTAPQTGLSTLFSLPTYFPENRKKDITAKLIHLLFMESEGTVTLSQSEPFGEIIIKPSTPDKNNLHSDESEGSLIIIDQSAIEYQFNWHDLSDAQRSRVIADLKENKILCRPG